MLGRAAAPGNRCVPGEQPYYPLRPLRSLSASLRIQVPARPCITLRGECGVL
jgi:hypothetical protein